jgi:hypothetical protein
LQHLSIEMQHARPGRPCAGEETVAGGEGEPRVAGLVGQAVPAARGRRRRPPYAVVPASRGVGNARPLPPVSPTRGSSWRGRAGLRAEAVGEDAHGHVEEEQPEVARGDGDGETPRAP